MKPTTVTRDEPCLFENKHGYLKTIVTRFSATVRELCTRIFVSHSTRHPDTVSVTSHWRILSYICRDRVERFITNCY